MSEAAVLGHVAAAIRRERKRAGLTMSQLAELADIDPGFLAYIETAKKLPSLLTAAKVAKALNIPLVRLFSDGPKPAKDSNHEPAAQLRALFHGRTAGQRAELIVLLKQLHDHRRVRALLYIMGR